MSASSLLRKLSSNTLSKLICNFTLARSMGGGPRTFPGGLNKWQWKRLHEKKAKEKEKNLLQQEKQLYQARIRTQIRAKLTGKHYPDEQEGLTHGPMTAKDHVKALADRFMKEGAEDLWNEDDGPLKSAPPQSPRMRGRDFISRSAPRIDVREIVSGGRRLLDGLSGPSAGIDSVNRRQYCSRSGDEVPIFPCPLRHDVSGSFVNSVKIVGGRPSLADYVGIFNFPLSFTGYKYYSVETSERSRSRDRSRRSWNSSSEDNESEMEDFDGESGSRVRRRGKEMMSSAALRNHDAKKVRRVPWRPIGEKDVSAEVQMIREEFRTRTSVEREERKIEGRGSLLSEKRFDECNISPLTLKALTVAGYVQMTKVQEATLSYCLEGKDVLVKAKTGTGKSAAFLLPAIEAVVKAKSSDVNQRIPPILVLILCPTRELASQIAAEAKVLVHYHSGIGVQTLIGGTRFKDDLKRLESNPSEIIVATPGRLLEHIENKSGFSVRLMGLKLLILDEADHLLDLGFRKDIEKLVDCVPRQRQTMLFSATIPKEVRRTSQLVLRKDHVYIDTVGLRNVETHEKVLQCYMVAPHENHFYIVHHLVKEHIMRVVDYKVIVFCTTAVVTSLLYQLLREMKLNVREIHSRKPQIYRTRISDEFRESKRLILVTSDVSARGLNYPDVSLVIQVGVPTDREQYIHRLGRTGREGKDGEGILLLAPWEEYFLDEIKDLPIRRSPLPQLESDMKVKVDNSISMVDSSVKEAAYHAWLGYYNSIREIGRDKTMLVELANKFCESIGLERPPALFRKTANKMGLRDIPGIRIRK
ncbi:probable DEAD-box ATP-dependent RNA helicase 48 [Aristolochia californica]|uniref:probable DEAD-box ATP-dependent RNA helicase 48 n=1 Tax=Aristolochia californica TaxID=171875 RepID=UPI0035D683FB